MEVTNWMMVCIYSPSFSILVNDSPTIFFPSNQELIKGYPLLPLLFILVIEGLSRIILHVKVEHKIKGINITHSLPITHLLFVDDVLIFGLGNREEWELYRSIIKIFCNATEMMISKEKSIFLHNNPEVVIC